MPPPPAAVPPLWAYVAGGAGLALIGVSVGFGFDTLDAGNDLDADCGEARNCTSDFDRAFETHAREERSFAFFVGLGATGVAAIGAGAVGALFFREVPDEATALELDVTPWATPQSGGLSIQGSF